jgi:hypothetical protein
LAYILEADVEMIYSRLKSCQIKGIGKTGIWTQVWIALFLSVNLIDALLTNRLLATGLGIEGNPIMQPLAGTSLLCLKGLFLLPLIWLVCHALKVRLVRILAVATIGLAGICIWNAYWLGVL